MFACGVLGSVVLSGQTFNVRADLMAVCVGGLA